MTGIPVPAAEVNEWLDVLKPYQRSTLEVFLGDATIEEAAEQWLASTGSPNVIPFGGERDTKPFWDRFSEEFRKFVCDDDAYTAEKKALLAEEPIGKALLVSSVSGALGATIGYSATLLAPAITLLLCAVGQMGINAYCNVSE